MQKLETYRWTDGERFSHLLDVETRLPHQASLLYVTAQIRNKSLSLSKMQAEYGAINILLKHFRDSEIAIEERFQRGEYLSPVECEKLRRAAQIYMGRVADSTSTVVPIDAGKRGFKPKIKVASAHQIRARMTIMANYLKWLAEEVAEPVLNSQKAFEIGRMRSNILALRPVDRRLGSDVNKNSWSAQDDLLLHEIITPGSPRNPFRGEGVQVRNYFALQLLRVLGKRKSELLNIWAKDVDARRQLLSIVRRPDSDLDPRLDQPRVKTREHTIAVESKVLQLYQDYLAHRRKIPGASKHPYLFVTHKSGPTLGQPMTKGALEEVFRAIKREEPRISHLHPHLLRHHFNEKLSEKFDEVAGERKEDEEIKIRANLNGWSEDSDMARVYNKRHIARKSHAMGLTTQRDLAKTMQLRDKSGKDVA